MVGEPGAVHSQTFGSNARVRWDRPDRLSRSRTEKDLSRILELLPEIRAAWDHAVEGGAWPTRSGEIGPGSSILQHRPTESAVFSPTRAQLRRAGRHAAAEISQARMTLEYAADILAHGMLRTDPETLSQHLEKRQAATQRPK